jgi:mRNA interferase RelE/StbE
MNHTLVISRRAQRELRGLPPHVYPKVRQAIRELGQDPRPAGCRKLTGRDGWRIAVDEYRVIYEIDDAQQLVTVLHVGHRRDVYR